MPNSNYNKIANEYYDLGHTTCRNFDNTTMAALRNNPILCSSGMMLEVGAGRGRAIEYLGANHSQIVQLDSSKAMFELEGREPCSLKVLADACDIPLVSGQFKYVVGFLVDPFMGLDFLGEAFRMLEKGGQLIFTVPTKTWGNALRSKLQIDKRTTRFNVLTSEEIVMLPSILNSEEKINEMLTISGFREICINAYSLAGNNEFVSPDIKLAAEELNIDTGELKIINIVTAIK